jgi:DNA-binding phage protein
MASFDEGDALLDSVLKVVDGITVTSKDDHINVLKGLFTRAKLSPEIKIALKPCLARTIYKTLNDQGNPVVSKLVNNEIFEDEKNRGDYLIVLKEVLEYNLSPFFVPLISAFSDLESKISALQKQK